MNGERFYVGFKLLLFNYVQMISSLLKLIHFFVQYEFLYQFSTCLAKTEYDNVTASAHLIVQDVPNKPELLSVECRPRDAAVKWKAMGDNGAAILHYIIRMI